MTPRMIGPCTIVRELGRGGVGVVYEARDALGRAVAIKVLLEASPVALQRFEREAHALGALAHPNIVVAHSFGRSPQGPYLVTELVPGEPLDEVCKRGPLPPAQAAEITRQLASAVARAHAAGVLHRDLKPQNVILRPDGAPVLLDFGLARPESAERLTQTGALIGTPAYMAPEQAGEDGGGLDERADVYGLGAVLFHLLHGRAPFSASGPMQLVKKVLMDEPEWPSPPTAPPELEAVCRKAMAKDRDARHVRAAALADDLARVLRGEAPVAATRGGRRALPVAAGLVALALAAAGIVAWRDGSAPEAAPPVDDAPAPPPPAATPVDPRREARRALSAASGARDWLAVAIAAERLLELEEESDDARRALTEARGHWCWSATNVDGPSFPRLLPTGPQGARMLLTTSASTARLWDLARPSVEEGRRSFEHPIGAAVIDAGRGCAWTAVGEEVLALALPSLAPQGAPISLPSAARGLVASAAALSEDGARLALAMAGDRRGGVVLVDLATRRANALVDYDFPAWGVTFARDGAVWAVAGARGEDEEFSLPQAIDALAGGARRSATPSSGTPSFVVQARDGALVVGSTTSDLRLVDPALAREDVFLRQASREKDRRGSEGQPDLPTFAGAACFAGRWLVVATARAARGPAEEDAIVVYDLEGAATRLERERLEPAWSVPVPGGSPLSIDVSDDGRLVVVARRDGGLLAFPLVPR